MICGSLRINSESLGINTGSLGINAKGLGINTESLGINAKSLGINAKSLGINPESPGIGKTGNYFEKITRENKFIESQNEELINNSLQKQGSTASDFCAFSLILGDRHTISLVETTTFKKTTKK
jgi:hypothetical protein